ncbi:unnamed protein product [Camellia sinensis]
MADVLQIKLDEFIITVKLSDEIISIVVLVWRCKINCIYSYTRVVVLVS